MTNLVLIYNESVKAYWSVEDISSKTDAQSH